MSASDSIGYFVELGEYNLIIARTTLGQRPRTVEAIQEVWLGDTAAADAALGEIRAGSTSAKAVALLRLKSRSTFLANADQAKSVTTPEAVENFLRTQLGAENLPANWAWCGASSGLAPQGGSPWALDAAPATTTEEIINKLRGWSFELVRCQSAPLTLAGALASAAQNSCVLHLEVSEFSTSLISVTKQGIGALVTAPVGFDSLAGATQTSLGLKFRGSAARLMFNESYDFSEAAVSIVDPLANAVKAALPNLGGTAPTHLVCGGILSRQTWIAQALAKSLNLSLFTFDATAWAGTRGLTLGGSVNAANIAPSWLGVLSAASSYEIATPGGVRAWNPVLSGTPLAAAPIVPAILVEPAKPATPPPAIKPATPAIVPAIIQEPAKPAVIPAIIQEPAKAATPAAAAPAKPATPAIQPKPAVVITPPSKPVEAPKPAAATPPAKPATPPPAASKPAEVKPPVAAASAKPATTPTPAKPTPPPVAKPAPKPEPAKPSSTAKPAPAPVLSGTAKPATAAPFPPKKNNMGIIIGVAAAVIIGVVVFFVVSGNKTKAQQAENEKKLKQEADARFQAEARARAEAEKKAEAERLARQKELEMAEQRLKNAEEEAKRQQEAARNSLLFGRGNLTIATEPAGATVTVGELAPKSSPVSMKDLRLGTYTVTITLPGYDTERRDIEIKEKENTDLGVITLKRQVGTIELTSEPSSLPYEVKPAGSASLFVNPSDIHTGQTPATLTGLPVGSYQVTITRANWAPNVSTVTVERNGTVKVNGDFPGGTVVINSSPSGATVLRDNKDSVGTTPLTLNGIPLGNVSYTVTLRGYDPVTLTGKLDGGKPLSLNATLLDSDRVMKLSELDERPTPIGQADPELTTGQRAEGGKAIISLVVGRDGIPTELKIEQASSPAFGKACLTAAAKWRFKPGTIRGKPAKSRVSIPFTVGAE
jgi:TonB family protein